MIVLAHSLAAMLAFFLVLQIVLAWCMQGRGQ